MLFEFNMIKYWRKNITTCISGTTFSMELVTYSVNSVLYATSCQNHGNNFLLLCSESIFLSFLI